MSWLGAMEWAGRVAVVVCALVLAAADRSDLAVVVLLAGVFLVG